MSSLARVVSTVEFWAAVIAAAASITAAIIAKSGGSQDHVSVTELPTVSSAGNQTTGSSVSCFALLERTRAWANANPDDAAEYAAVGDADGQGLPSLWSSTERSQCSADPERLLERLARARRSP